MASTGLDRIRGLDPSVAIKAPCRMATTGSIALSGLQTIDGVSGAEGDRVLVRAQSDSRDNGIYVMRATAWERAKDFNGPRDFVRATLVSVDSGTLHGNTTWRVNVTNPPVVGVTQITFTMVGQFDAGSEIIHSTIAQMVANTELAEGMTIRTLEHTSGYGYEGGNLYKIGSGFGTADGGSIIDLDNGLQAMGLFPNGVNVKQFGAGEGDAQSAATTNALNSGLAYCSTTGEVLRVPPCKADTYAISTPVHVPENTTVVFDPGAKLSISLGYDVGQGAPIRFSGVCGWSGVIDIDLLGENVGGIAVSGAVVTGDSIIVRSPGGQDQDRNPVRFTDCTGIVGTIEIVGGGEVGTCDGVRLQGGGELWVRMVKADGYYYRLVSCAGGNGHHIEAIVKTGPGCNAFYSNDSKDVIIDSIYARGINADNGVRFSRGTTNCVVKHMDVEVDEGCVYGLGILGGIDCKILSGRLLKKTGPSDSGGAAGIILRDHPLEPAECTGNYVKLSFGLIGVNDLVQACVVTHSGGPDPVRGNVLELTAIAPHDPDVTSNILIDSAGYFVERTIVKDSLLVNRRDLGSNARNAAVGAQSSGGTPPTVEVYNSAAYSVNGPATQSMFVVHGCRLRTINGSSTVSGSGSATIAHNLYRGGSALSGDNVESSNILDL